MLRIRELRKAKGITLRELSERALISTSAVSTCERGVCLPRLDMLPDLAAALDCTMDELFTDEVKRLVEAKRKKLYGQEAEE